MRPIADVPSAVFENVVGEKDHRHPRRDLAHLALTPDALLQIREWSGLPLPEGDDLAIQDGAGRQTQRRGRDLRKALGDQLLAARPEKDAATSVNELRPDAVPLPFGDPRLARSE